MQKTAASSFQMHWNISITIDTRSNNQTFQDVFCINMSLQPYFSSCRAVIYDCMSPYFLFLAVTPF